MELDKILKLGIEYVSDYVEDFLQVIRNPGLQLRPTPLTTEDAANIITSDSDAVRVRLNPRLVRFLIISIFLGSVVNERIPGRPPAQQLVVTTVILIVYWTLFSAVSHLICRMFGSRITFTETLSACLQVFPVIYFLSSCCAFVWGVIVYNLNLASSPIYFRLLGEHPIYAYFVFQFPLTLAYLIVAMKRVHKFTFQKHSKTTVSHIGLPHLESVAFFLVFLVTTIMIVGISKFNYEVHNIPLEQGDKAEELNMKPFTVSSTRSGEYCTDGHIEGVYQIRPDSIVVKVTDGEIHSCKYSRYDGPRNISITFGMAKPDAVNKSTDKKAIWSRKIHVGTIYPGETFAVSSLEVAIPVARTRKADLFANKLVVLMRDESPNFANRQLLLP